MSWQRSSNWICIFVVIFAFFLTACERPLRSEESLEINDAETSEVDIEVAEEVSGVDGENDAESVEGSVVPGESNEVPDVVEDDGAAKEEQSVDDDQDADLVEDQGTEAESNQDQAGNASGSDGNSTEENTQSNVDSDAASNAETEQPTSSESGGAIGEALGETAESAEVAEAESDSPPEPDQEENNSADKPGDPTEGQTNEGDESEASSALPATHTVQPGETLYEIGLQYGLSWLAIAQFNNIWNANYVYAGQVLNIPGGVSPEDQGQEQANESDQDFIEYVVKFGDNLAIISQLFGVTPAGIIEANGIVNPNLVYAGQVLKIPTSTPVSATTITHVVQWGETLYSISLQYGVPWLSIAQINSINPPYAVYAGQILEIPGG